MDWVKITSKNLPPKNIDLLFYRISYGFIIGSIDTEDYAFIESLNLEIDNFSINFRRYQITHFMQLPEIPKLIKINPIDIKLAIYCHKCLKIKNTELDEHCYDQDFSKSDFSWRRFYCLDCGDILASLAIHGCEFKEE